MFITRLLKVASVGFVLGATASGVEWLAQEGSAGIKAPPRETPVVRMQVRFRWSFSVLLPLVILGRGDG